MCSSDTGAHNHVNSHILRRITSHTYNTLPVLFSNLFKCGRPDHLTTGNIIIWKPKIYQRYRSIHVKKSLRPTFEYSWGAGVKGMFPPLISRSVDPVCSNISPLYQIISSRLAIISPISNENYVSITYVTLKAPGSGKSIS